MSDVVVIGTGCAGLAAAVSAAEAGARVTALEKTGRIGGAIRGGAGLFAVETRMQRDRQIALTRDEAFHRLMEHAQWRTDARLVSAYVNQSADTVEWLAAMGVEFSDVVAYYLGAEPTWHYREPDSPEITAVLEGRARALGVAFHTSSRATRLLVEDGSVTGVEYTTADGVTHRPPAGAVVLATGGFGGSRALIEQHTGYRHGQDLFSFAFPELTGDGIEMALSAGAAPTDTMVETYVCLPEPYWGPGGTPVELGSFRQPNLMVNHNGERFMDESTMRHPGYAANAVHRQPGGHGYMILTSDINSRYERHGWDFLMSKLPVTRPDDFDGAVGKAVAEGFPHVFRAGSLAELADLTGIDEAGLAVTADAYNHACWTGRDSLMFKQGRYLHPLEGGTYYAARFYVGGYGTVGGFAVDDHGRALDRDANPVAGLYGAGRDVNTLYGGTYPFVMAGNSTSFSYNSGRIAGRTAAAG
ncbi:FAD-dependent oxidoreductase [Streptomyces sp. NBC_00988]|uniref:FAD-dependent oxidoreductase n=1 Tax=Streptomyces sp. NBC_00988 TaxID=2903704 RepID=UPI0038695326|nr:FAD-dependent oxidoreductase [Streptomyces sp. NBC_00988]